MTGPKKRGPKPGQARRSNTYKVCATCSEEKALTEFTFAYWRTGWKTLVAADPDKYRDSCRECTRYKNAIEHDPDFPADRGRKPGRPRKDLKVGAGTWKQRVAARRRYQREYKQKVRRRARISCLRYLARKGCEECGERDPRVLEFDHKDRAKKNDNIAKMMSQGYSWSNEKLRREVRKCRVLCANCHRKHTIEQMGYYGHDEVRNALERIFDEYDIDG